MPKRVRLKKVRYEGGHPAFPNGAKNLVLVFDDRGVTVEDFNAHLASKVSFSVSWSSVRDIGFMGAETADRPISAVAIVGSLGFAARRKAGPVYLRVDTPGFRAGFTIPDTSVGELRGRLGPWLDRIASSLGPSRRPPPPAPVASRAVAKGRACDEGRWYTGEGGRDWYWTNMWFCDIHDRAKCADCGSPPSFVPGRAGDPNLSARTQAVTERSERPQHEVESLAAEIRRLAGLREEGLLSDAEFEQAKRKLLN